MNKKFMTLVGLLMAVTITSYSVSGTYAKYTEVVTGTADAKIAKWDIKFNDASVTDDGKFTFDLFKTVNDDENTILNQSADGATKIIAPGTSGEFVINIKNASDVNAKIESFEITNSTAIANLKYTYKVNNVVKTMDQIKDITLSTTDNIAITVNWVWAFEADTNGMPNSTADDLAAIATKKDAYNDADTTVGKGAVTASDFTATAKITVSQAAKA